MAQYIKQPSLGARIGTGIGQGLADILPKEMERGRLSAGLRQLEEQPNLTPQQYFSRALSIPGLIDRPQAIQSLADLARQQIRGQALIQQQNQQNQPPPNPFPPPKPKASTTDIPSVTKPKSLEEIQKGYIPPTQEQIFEDAGRRYNENPALYGNDPNNAIKAAEDAALREKQIYEAYKGQHSDLQNLQDNVVSRLKDHSTRLNAQIPANLYSRIEDKAINAVKPKSEGGEGLTEQQAMKKYGAEMDAASRDYEKLGEIGNWGITGRKAFDTLNSFKSLQKSAEQRGDTENMADAAIAENKISPKLSFSIFQPVSGVPEASKFIKSLPVIEPIHDLFFNAPDVAKSEAETKKIAPNLAELVRKNEKLSPLAVAYELEKKGYSPSIWMKYLADNKEYLNLRANQSRQIDRPLNTFDPLNDLWLESWSGLE